MCLILWFVLASIAHADPDLPGPSPTLEVIPAGSLVIAMDNDKQNLSAVFNLKAYGLVNDLLWSGIPVRWAIRAGKSKDGIDFTAPAQRLFPSASAAATLDFRGGPFIVHRDWAGYAKQRIGNYGNSVAVYELTADATIDIRYKLTQRRKIGVLDDGGNAPIHAAVLDAAGFVSGIQYVEISATSLTTVNADTCITGASEPHWNSGSPIDPQALAVRTFLVSGGNFLAQCAAIPTYENDLLGLYQTTLGVDVNNVGDAFTYPNPDLAYSQFEGDLGDGGGSVQDFRLALLSSFRSSAHAHARDTPTTNTYAATAARINAAGPGSLVMYLGGHNYDGTDLGSLNGARMYLNWAMIPSVRPPPCLLDFVDDPSALRRISGRVLEDVNGDGDLSDAVGALGARVRVYADGNGNGAVDAADTYLGAVLTGSGGAWDIQVNRAATGDSYVVVVDSRSIAPAAGLNAGSTLGDVWAEQTYGDGPTTAALDVGPRFGGVGGAVSDAFNVTVTTAAANTYEHLARVSVGSGDVAGVDFGFSFNVVTSIRGGDNADDDSSSNRSVQGSLRQFLQNANAIAGANAMRFIPTVPTNAAGGGGGSWWTLPVTLDLPVVRDAGTTIDGTAYALTDGTTLRDTNPGVLGAGGVVGVEALAVPQVERPELEIADANNRLIGLDLQAAGATVRRIAIRGFGRDQNRNTDADLRVGAFAGARIELCVVGTAPDAFTAQTEIDTGDCIRVVGGDAGRIERNLIGFCGGNGIGVSSGGDWTIEANEIRANGANNTACGGVLLDTSTGATVRGNRIWENRAEGVGLLTPTGPATIVDNTIMRNGSGGVQTAGVRLFGSSNVVDRNEITENQGAGVMVTSASLRNKITRNSIFANGTLAPATGQVGIDLLAGGNNQVRGTSPFFTLNDANDADNGGNALLNFPILESALLSGGNLTVSGWARPGAIVELFLADRDSSSFGEGKSWIATATEGSGSDSDVTASSYGPGAINGVGQGTDTTNRFRFVLPVTALAVPVTAGAFLTATATDASDATSEFSAVVTAAVSNADLDVTKSDGTTSATPGNSLTYTIRVTNHGPEAATAAQVADTLDPAIFDVTATSWTCAITTPGPGPDSCATAGPVSGNVATTVNLSAAAVATITVTAAIRPDATGTAGNTASATAVNESDPVSANDTATDADTVLAPLADLSLTMAADTTNPAPGATVTFTLTAANAGPSDASAVAITDLLPAGLTFLSDDGGGAYAAGSGIWTIGALARGATAILHLRVRMDVTSAVTNAAEVTASSAADPDSTPGNGSSAEDDRAAVVLTPDVADLSLIKTVDVPSPAVGTNVSFTLTVANAGPSPSTGVRVSDPLPNGYAYVSDDGAGAYDSATGSWNVGAIAVNGSVTLHVVARVLASGNYTNVAEVAACDQADPDSAPGNAAPGEDDYAQSATTPAAVADLSLIKTVDVPSPAVGTNVTFTLTAANAGPSPATGVRVSDPLPNGYAYVSDDGAGGYDVATGAWNAGGIAVSGSVTLHVVARVLASGNYTNVAEIAACDQADPDSTPGNAAPGEDDYAQRATTPAAVADLSLSKTVDVPSPAAGTNVTFTLTAANAGPSPATGVRVSDPLPNGYAYVSDDGAGAYDSATGAWNADAIAVSGSVTLHVVARVLASGNYTNVAEVAACDQADPDSTPGNAASGEDDYAQRATTPAASSDLSVTNSDGVTSYTPGGTLTYTIVVSNAGPSDASGVAVHDALLALPQVTSASWTCAAAGGASCTAGPVTGSILDTISIPVGGTATYTASVTLKSGASGDLVTQGTVALAAGAGDPDSSNDTASDTDTRGAPVADVSISKTDGTASYMPGGALTYTIVASNSGPSDAAGVVVHDGVTALPQVASATWTCAAGGGATCAAGTGAGDLNDTITLPSGGTASYTVHVTLRPEATGDIVNAASVAVAAGTVDPDSSNGTASDTDTQGAPIADLSLAATVDDPSPMSGGQVVFSLTVTNDGPSLATGIVVRAALPTGTTFVSDDGGGAYDSATGLWSLSQPLAPGTGVTLRITATVNTRALLAAEVMAAAAQDPDSTPGNGTTNGEDDQTTLEVLPDASRTLSIVKTVDRAAASIGQTVGYTVTIRNVQAFDVTEVTIDDSPPPGFAYVSGTARLNGVPIPDPTPGHPLVFAIGTVAAGQEVVLTYRLIVGAGARPGPVENLAVARTPGFTVSQEARVTVEIRLDPTFDLGTIIGKVFQDADGDGVQDPEEPGIVGARVALDDGTYAVTDAFGRYHLPALQQGRRMVKLDVASVAGATIADPVRIVWLTPGLMAQADFAVGLSLEVVSIGNEAKSGLAVGADEHALPVQVQGNADTLSVFVNGEPVVLNTGDARIGLEALAPILTVAARKLAEPIVFVLDQSQRERIAHWELTVRKRDGTVVHRRGGDGAPPPRVAWDGNGEDGAFALDQGSYEYFLRAVWIDGTDSRGPVRYFGVNAARMVAVRLTGEAFEFGRAELSEKAKSVLHQAAETLRRYPDETVVIEGHTDSIGSARSNVELARRRAESALRQLVDVEHLSADRFSVHAYGEDRPIAGNDTEEGRALNRRIEVKGDHKEVDESSITDVYRHPPYVLIDGVAVPLGTTNQFSRDVETSAPRMSIEAADSRGQLVRAEVALPTLRVTAPAGRFVVPEGGEVGGCRSRTGEGESGVVCRVAGTVDPGAALEMDGTAIEVAADGSFAFDIPLDPGKHTASLLARNTEGIRRVVELTLDVSAKDESGQRIEVDPGTPALSVGLPTAGTRLKSATLPVHGRVEPGVGVAINGQAVAVAPDGTFSTSVKLPPSNATLTIEATDAAGRKGTIARTFEVPKNELFLLAFAEGTVGRLSGQGYLEGAGLDGANELYTQGRLAYYLKGVIAGKYLITSALDTAKESGGSLLGDVSADQSRRLLTNLDPDKYYPVYGDTSEVVHDAESQGKFYLAVDSDEIHVLVGDYPLALNDTELASYQRTLYGGRFAYQSAARTRYGDPDTRVVLFGAEVRQAHVHDQLLATGGSLYYLSHRDVVEGSETVTIVVRDKNTLLQLRSQRQQVGVDYTVKYEEGRILFHRPIQMVEPGGSIVDQGVLEGNPIYVLVDYETVLTGFDKTGYGVRARQQIGDHVAVGGTYVQDHLGAGEYTLQGIDAEVKLGSATRIVTEFADSSGRNAEVFVSRDGGLTYAPAAATGAQDGGAWKIAADVDVGEWFGVPGRYRARAYFKDIEPGFFSNGTLLDQTPIGTVAAGTRAGSTKLGGDVEITLTAKDRIHLRGDRDEQTGSAGANETVTLAADWTHTATRWGLAVELFDTSSKGAATLPSRSYAAARYWTKLAEKITARIEHQQTISGSSNDRTSAGIEYQVLPSLAVEALASTGTLGSSAQAGLVYTHGASSIYLTERLAEDRAGERTSTVIGAKSPIGKATKVYTEYQWEDSSAGGRTISLAGLQRQWDPAPGLRFVVSGEAANVNADSGDSKRTALAAGVAFDNAKGLRISSRQEFRVDESAGRRQQYFTVNQLDYAMGPDLTLLARWRFSRTDNRNTGSVDADFDERVVGAAYRPVRHQRFNALFKYTSLAEQHPLSATTPPAGPRTSEVFSIDTAFRATPRIEWLAKEAMRREHEFSVRSTSFLVIQRLNFELWKPVGFGAEYRVLDQREWGGRRQGLLAEGYWKLQQHVRLGIGYDFTDFSDDGSPTDDYKVRGLFLRVQGSF